VAAFALELLVAAEDARVSREVCGRLADGAEALGGRRHGDSLCLRRVERQLISKESTSTSWIVTAPPAAVNLSTRSPLEPATVSQAREHRRGRLAEKLPPAESVDLRETVRRLP
jgi:hypothetical protein